MDNNSEHPFVKVKGSLDIPDVKVIDLPLKKEWYNMIESGIKKATIGVYIDMFPLDK